MIKKTKFPKFATLTIAYNEEKLIGGLLDGISDLDNYVMISKPFHIDTFTFDKTEEIVKEHGANVIRKDFESQLDERNWGMDFLQKEGYEYIFIFDADEYYLKEDIPKMIEFVEAYGSEAFKSNHNDYIYWKNEHWHFRHGGFTICLRADIRFAPGDRTIQTKDIKELPDWLPMHHFSYSRTDEEMKVKITTRDFSRRVLKNWYDEVWLKWTPEMRDLGPVSPKVFSIALPTIDMPQEILERYHKLK